MGSQSSKQANNGGQWDVVAKVQKEFDQAFCSFEDPGAYTPADVYSAALIEYMRLSRGISAGCARECMDGQWRCTTDSMHAVSSLYTGKPNVLVGVKLLAFPTHKTVEEN